MAKLRPSPYLRARETLLSGNVALRIQAMADLEDAVRNGQRETDARRAQSHVRAPGYCAACDMADVIADEIERNGS